jgi:D-inositol-3-phosphate glycosyltransferase
VRDVKPTLVALLTGGIDKPYAFGLASALGLNGVAVDFIGSDELDCAEIRAVPGLTFLNLRGDQREDAPFLGKLARILVYYARLVRYAAQARPSILHILWNNRFELVDRTLLMIYYRSLGKRLILTAHNVNAAARNGTDSWLNRLSLRIQYRLCHHLFVHTDAMKRQLVAHFAVPAERVTVIPFPVNDTVPTTGMNREAARQRLGIGSDCRALLFFGQIAPYKGLEYLVQAIALLARSGERVHVTVAGKVKRGSERYWRDTQRLIAQLGISELVQPVVRFIADDEVEPYFVAADAVVIPYVDIFQSGVPFLAFVFGVPVIATDVGSLREDVTGETGLLCRPRDPADLARAIKEFYQEEKYWASCVVRARIRRFVRESHSWEAVGERTKAVYVRLAPGAGLLRSGSPSAQQPQSGQTKCQE